MTKKQNDADGQESEKAINQMKQGRRAENNDQKHPAWMWVDIYKSPMGCEGNEVRKRRGRARAEWSKMRASKLEPRKQESMYVGKKNDKRNHSV